jgi:hypothetical protein
MTETEGSDMPAWIPLATAGISALGGLMSSKKEASSSTNAANILARSTANTARIRAQSEAAQLAFLRGESGLTRQQAAHTQQENYGMHDVSEQNIHNRRNADILNAYAAATTQGLNLTDISNVEQGNIFNRWTTGRADTNIQLARRDEDMSDLGVMLGIDRRKPFEFRPDPTLLQATYRPGEQPITPDRVTRAYNPFVPSGSSTA